VYMYRVFVQLPRGIARIWCREAQNEAMTARRRDQEHGGFMGGKSGCDPLNFAHNFFREISKHSASILLKYFQFQNLIYNFPEKITSCYSYVF